MEVKQQRINGVECGLHVIQNFKIFSEKLSLESKNYQYKLSKIKTLRLYLIKFFNAKT